MDNILPICDGIEAAAQGIYTKGCDGVAQNNMARLMEICNLVNQIRELAKEDK